MSNETLVVLKLTDLQKIGDYLVSKPYNESVELIELLKTAKVLEYPKEEVPSESAEGPEESSSNPPADTL